MSGNLILLFAEDPAVIRWAEEEVDDKGTSFFVMSKLPELIWALTQDVPPRPQVVVLDFDALSPAALLELHAARERWFGAIIALGTVSNELKTSLNIDYVLPRPLGSEALRDTIGRVGLDKLTVKMPKLKRP